MHSPTLTPANFPFAFSELIATAAMGLPPLTRPQDSEFLRKMTEVAMDAFWQNYVADLPMEAKTEFDRAADSDDGDVLYEWFKKHADFEEDPLAEAKGRAVLLELQEKLPAILMKEYDLFTEDDAEAS